MTIPSTNAKETDEIHQMATSRRQLVESPAARHRANSQKDNGKHSNWKRTNLAALGCRPIISEEALHNRCCSPRLVFVSPVIHTLYCQSSKLSRMSVDIPKPSLPSAPEPDAGVLETITTALEASTVQGYDNTSDLDLVNILYVQRLPSVPDAKKAALSANVESISLWLAWELTKVEEQVNGKINGKQLPNDASVASKSKRTAYRCKVVDYYRNESPW